MQLAVCSLLVRMCCVQSWWGDFIAETFTTLYSSQNSQIFPQDRYLEFTLIFLNLNYLNHIFLISSVFFLLTYLGRKSIALVPTRPLVIDAMLRALATQLVPISTAASVDPIARADHQLISWLLLFLSVCLDDTTASNSTNAATASDKKEPHASRWEFMSGETDMTKSRSTCPSSGHGSRSFSRSFKKRYLQGKTMGSGGSISGLAAGGSGGSCVSYVLDKMAASPNDKSLQVAQLTSQIEKALKQQEHLIKKHNVKMHQLQYCLENNKLKNAAKLAAKAVNMANEASGSGGSGSGASGGGTSGTTTGNSTSSGGGSDPEPAFDQGLRSLKVSNTIVVIRGLIGLLLAMNYSCNTDLFLLTCKVLVVLNHIIFDIDMICICN